MATAKLVQKVLQGRIDDAAAEIDGYLCIRYAVPGLIYPVPGRIRDLA